MERILLIKIFQNYSIWLKKISNKIEAKKRQLELIDSIEFKKYRKYMIYLFKKKNV